MTTVIQCRIVPSTELVLIKNILNFIQSLALLSATGSETLCYILMLTRLFYINQIDRVLFLQPNNSNQGKGVNRIRWGVATWEVSRGKVLGKVGHDSLGTGPTDIALHPSLHMAARGAFTNRNQIVSLPYLKSPLSMASHCPSNKTQPWPRPQGSHPMSSSHLPSNFSSLPFSHTGFLAVPPISEDHSWLRPFAHVVPSACKLCLHKSTWLAPPPPSALCSSHLLREALPEHTGDYIPAQSCSSSPSLSEIILLIFLLAYLQFISHLWTLSSLRAGIMV